VRFLHERRREALSKAGKRGHLDVVRFLCANRTEGCSLSAIDKAASRNHLEIACLLPKR
jgi:hypothetical protein